MREFLTERRARIKVGEDIPPPIELGSRGTPQGSVISPLLFNIALLGLPRVLGAIEGLGQALYADDVSLWTTKAGFSEWIQDTLQAAADVGDAVKLMDDLRDKYLKTEKIGGRPGSYRGAPNESLDRPFIDSELRFAIAVSN